MLSWGYLTILVITTGMVKAKGAAACPAMYRKVFTTKKYQVQNVSSVKVKNPCSRASRTKL